MIPPHAMDWRNLHGSTVRDRLGSFCFGEITDFRRGSLTHPGSPEPASANAPLAQCVRAPKLLRRRHRDDVDLCGIVKPKLERGGDHKAHVIVSSSMQKLRSSYPYGVAFGRLSGSAFSAWAVERNDGPCEPLDQCVQGSNPVVGCSQRKPVAAAE